MTHTVTALIIFVLTYSVIAIGKVPWLRLTVLQDVDARDEPGHDD